VKPDALLEEALKLLDGDEQSGESVKAEVFDRIILRYAEAGRFDRAAQLAERVGDPAAKAADLLAVALTCADQGQKERAADIARRALDVAGGIEGAAPRTLYLASTAAQFKKFGRGEEGLQLLSRIAASIPAKGEASERAFETAAVADAYLMLGEKGKALEFAARAFDLVGSADGGAGGPDALPLLVRLYAVAGRFDEALRVERLSEEANDDRAVMRQSVEIADGYFAAGQKSKAVETIERMTRFVMAHSDDPGRAHARAFAGIAYAKYGEYEKVLQTASDLRGDYLKRRSIIYSALAREYMKAGRKALALGALGKAAAALRAPSAVEMGFRIGRDAVIEDYAALGRDDLALQVVKDTDEQYRDEAYATLASAAAAAGRVAAALQYAASIPAESPAQKARALASIAASVAKPQQAKAAPLRVP
jgi:hypothetical protein